MGKLCDRGCIWVCMCVILDLNPVVMAALIHLNGGEWPRKYTETDYSTETVPMSSLLQKAGLIGMAKSESQL